MARHDAAFGSRSAWIFEVDRRRRDSPRRPLGFARRRRRRRRRPMIETPYCLMRGNRGENRDASKQHAHRDHSEREKRHSGSSMHPPRLARCQAMAGPAHLGGPSPAPVERTPRSPGRVPPSELEPPLTLPERRLARVSSSESEPGPFPISDRRVEPRCRRLAGEEIRECFSAHQHPRSSARHFNDRRTSGAVVVVRQRERVRTRPGHHHQ